MTPGCGDEAFLAAGGPARHVPVLRDEVIAALAPREGGLYLDATFGAGGYSRTLLAMPKLRVLALDRDPIAIAGGASLVNEAQGRLCLVKERFGRLDQVARVIEAGPDTLGISFEEMSPDLKKALAGADLVISKGQANYYVLSEHRHEVAAPIAYLLRTKCDLCASEFGQKGRIGIAVLR